MRLHSALAAAAVVSIGFTTASGAAGITADSVVDYTAGTPSNFTTPAAALGPLTGDTNGGNGLNPFDPPYKASQIVIVGAGGQLTLHLSAPIPTAAVAGPTLGVFVNNGIADVGGGSGVAGNPATTFSPFAEAVVQVSGDGSTYVPLNGGNPIVFSDPTNYYLDSTISGYNEPLGTSVADEFAPFVGTLASFNGETFAQALTTLHGTAGGNWLDLSGTGLTAVNDVRFVVPAAASYRLVLDAVAAVPEPTVALTAVASAALLARRRRPR